MTWVNIAITAIAVGIGGLITWLVSKRFYVKASKELTDETEMIVKRADIILVGLEEAFKMKLVTRDRDGTPKGNVKYGEANIDV